MTLVGLKSLVAIAIFALTLLAGLLSIGFANRFQKQMEIGDAFANGIFIGAALFHLIPEAVVGFQKLQIQGLYSKTVLLLTLSYFLFWLVEKVWLTKKNSVRQRTHIAILVVILSIHALIAGIALGISETYGLVFILFVAIIAHKGFEAFALIINLYQQTPVIKYLAWILIFFSLITPLGIFIGLIGDTFLAIDTDNLLTAIFSAIAAGTFLYIGTTHSHRLHGTHQEYYAKSIRFFTTLFGMLVMGVLAIWT